MLKNHNHPCEFYVVVLKNKAIIYWVEPYKTANIQSFLIHKNCSLTVNLTYKKYIYINIYVCIYTHPIFLYSFIHWWTLRLFLRVGSSKILMMLTSCFFSILCPYEFIFISLLSSWDYGNDYENEQWYIYLSSLPYQLLWN